MESDCKVCQCIGNAYVCDTETCTKEIVKVVSKPQRKEDDGFDGEDDTNQNITVNTVEQQPIIVNTVTPPAKCDGEK